MADKVVRWGILSTAAIGARAFVPALKQTRRGQLAAVASRSRERGASFAHRHGIPLVFDDYADLLASDQIDAVYNPLPNSMHAEWTLAAARQGKHIFCEKPLALSPAEAGRMVEACQQAGVLLFEAFVFLCHPQTRRLRHLLDEGAIGRLMQVQAQMTFPLARPTDNIRMNRELGGGSLMDVGCYPITFARFAFSEEPLSVQATCRMDPDYGVDTRAGMLLNFSGERFATLQAGFDAPGGQAAVLFGESGYIEVSKPYHPGEQSQIAVHAGGKDEVLSFDTGTMPFAPAIEHFHDCILDGVALIATGAYATGTLEIIEAVRESSRIGRRVELG
ncbi:MAG: Gfo/Idh/MocA family oxidoreductase [Candidatus Handelsmanbacteria bacterium]|nr:Gfo/Idh/MocA family oxidoreductase [Candidatus Handelsmanbacteria bacterium]